MGLMPSREQIEAQIRKVDEEKARLEEVWQEVAYKELDEMASALGIDFTELRRFTEKPDPLAPHPDWCLNPKAHHKWYDCYGT